CQRRASDPFHSIKQPATGKRGRDFPKRAVAPVARSLDWATGRWRTDRAAQGVGSSFFRGADPFWPDGLLILVGRTERRVPQEGFPAMAEPRKDLTDLICRMKAGDRHARQDLFAHAFSQMERMTRKKLDQQFGRLRFHGIETGDILNDAMLQLVK